MTANTVGRPRLVPVELARDLVCVDRHIFDRAVAKVAIGLTPEFAEEFCRQVSSRIVDVPMIVEKKAQTPAPLSWADIVFEKDGVPMADSRKVAEVFEKEHKHVLRDIDGIIERWPDRGGSNFGRTSYTDASNRQKPFYLMTRDGFAFLALGWKTERAEGFKWTFMDAFNAMEAELRRRIEEDRIKVLAEAKAALADAERGRKQAEDQRVGAQRAATAIRESMDKQANELKALRAQAGGTATHLCENSYLDQ